MYVCMRNLVVYSLVECDRRREHSDSRLVTDNAQDTCDGMATLNLSIYPPIYVCMFMYVCMYVFMYQTIPDSSWEVPCGLVDQGQWAARKHFDIGKTLEYIHTYVHTYLHTYIHTYIDTDRTDYFMMGRWRLTFSLDFARRMGYKYHLQFDDDAMLNGKHIHA